MNSQPRRTSEHAAVVRADRLETAVWDALDDLEMIDVGMMTKVPAMHSSDFDRSARKTALERLLKPPYGCDANDEERLLPDVFAKVLRELLTLSIPSDMPPAYNAQHTKKTNIPSTWKDLAEWDRNNKSTSSSSSTRRRTPLAFPPWIRWDLLVASNNADPSDVSSDGPDLTKSLVRVAKLEVLLHLLATLQLHRLSSAANNDGSSAPNSQLVDSERPPECAHDADRALSTAEIGAIHPRATLGPSPAAAASSTTTNSNEPMITLDAMINTFTPQQLELFHTHHEKLRTDYENRRRASMLRRNLQRLGVEEGSEPADVQDRPWPVLEKWRHRSILDLVERVSGPHSPDFHISSRSSRPTPRKPLSEEDYGLVNASGLADGNRAAATLRISSSGRGRLDGAENRKKVAEWSTDVNSTQSKAGVDSTKDHGKCSNEGRRNNRQRRKKKNPRR